LLALALARALTGALGQDLLDLREERLPLLGVKQRGVVKGYFP